MKKSVVLSASSAIALAIGACAIASPALAQQAGDNAAEAAQSATTVPGDIIVTARRREESLLDTPLAISALSSEEIAAKGIVSVNDVAANTPGINITTTSSGRSDRSFQQVALRGFTPTTANAILVSTFIDGVPVASATALNSITDPERIEILKGPQAAYFGRNTFAGAINVVNKMPGNDLGGSVSASVGTRNFHEIVASLEGPLISDKLLFRVTGRDFARDGSWKNAANPGQTLGDQSTRTGTLLLVAKPTEQLTVKAFGLLSSDDDGPSADGALFAYELRANNGTINVPALSGSTAGTVIMPSLSNCRLNGLTSGLSASEARVSRPYFCGAVPSPAAGFSPAANTIEDRLLANSLGNGNFRFLQANQGVDGYGLRRRFYHLHLNVDYEVGDTGLTLSSLTGYNNERYSALDDLDNYDNSLLRNPSNPTGANLNRRTSWDFPFAVERGTRDFSQEFRISYDNDGPFTGVIGGSYLYTNVEADLVNVQAEVLNEGVRASTSRSPRQRARTFAGFFGLTYNLTEQLKLSAEGRYQFDRIYAFTGGNTAGLTISPTNQFGLPPGTYGPLTQFYSKLYKTFLPRVIVQYDVTPDVMAYASYSKGANITLAQFNTGFLNGSPAVAAAAETIGLDVVVEPETLENFEVGLKGKFLDGRVRAQLSAYYAKWKNQQNVRSTVIIDQAPPLGTGGAVIVSGVANTGDTVVKGIEADIAIVPFDGFTLTLAGAINDSKIRSYADPSISKITGLIGDDFRNKQLPYTSKYSANVGAQYGTEIAGWDDGRWFIRGDLSYKSKVYSNPANLYWIKSRTLVNFRAGVSRGPFSLEGFVLNALNNKKPSSIIDQAILTPDFALSATNSYLLVSLPDLRTWGLKASVKF